MATLKLNNTTNWSTNTTAPSANITNTWTKWMRWADTQKDYKTIWFLVSLIAQGVLFLPIPAVLMYYYGAPLVVLGVTMVLFFANIIAGMGGSGIRVLIGFLFSSIVIHLLMLAVFIL